MVAPSPDLTAAVRVRLFAALRERAGWGERLVPLEASPTSAADLWRRLALDDGPATGGRIPPSIRIAINQAFAAPGTPLRPGDEVAFLPPITGG
ncbi:MoaD/ThiS family protein [Cyanobium gracile]|uniref:MoaD/ThiS family protein n=1 Tax=Cyanobium gracile UHCC 0281 TaxID=3110309 RepID=A0ABU5SZ70_9CYAN|nr:MoaD/ThiS family protein [Cyanobium gracile]MEA5443789.1 MoaD/ThiS family protein [Cyanobium gracile UHCC 0281]